jgi:hypothetical protein
MSQVLQPFSHGARAPSWMLRGACQRVDPELFFPIAGPSRRSRATAGSTPRMRKGAPKTIYKP